MEFRLSYFKSKFEKSKNDAVKVLHSICQQIWKTQQWPQDQKKSVFIPIPKKGNAKESSNCCTIVFISHASKIMLKILQARLQQYMNLQIYKLNLERAKEPEIKLPTCVGSQRKQGNSRKTSTSASSTILKHLTVWITTNWKILKEMGTPDHLTYLWQNLYSGQEVTFRTRHGTMD